MIGSLLSGRRTSLTAQEYADLVASARSRMTRDYYSPRSLSRRCRANLSALQFGRHGANKWRAALVFWPPEEDHPECMLYVVAHDMPLRSSAKEALDDAESVAYDFLEEERIEREFRYELDNAAWLYREAIERVSWYRKRRDFEYARQWLDNARIARNSLEQIHARHHGEGTEFDMESLL